MIATTSTHVAAVLLEARREAFATDCAITVEVAAIPRHLPAAVK
jgi:hypothetical protein